MKRSKYLNFASLLRKSVAVVTSIAVAAVVLVMPLRVSALDTNPNYAGGTGYPDDPYLISNLQQFEYFRDQVNSGASRYESFRLTADIDLSGLNWLPIGSIAYPFGGNFDGGGHTISNLTIGSEANPSGEHDLGLFGYVGYSATVISYLNVSNAAIYSGNYLGYAGVIAGELGSNYNLSLYDCHASGQIVCLPGAGTDVGGLVGYIQASGGNVNECSSSVSVTGDFFSTGGLVGVNCGTIKNSFSSGTLGSNTPGTGNFSVGGIAGSNYNLIENSYFTGTISDPFSSTQYVGEIAGSNDHSDGSASTGSIQNCYSTFVPMLPMSIGGVAGYQTGGAVSSNNYWCSDGGKVTQAVLSGDTVSPGCQGMPASLMQAAAFITTLNTSASAQPGCYQWQAPSAGENGGLPVLVVPGHSAELLSLKIDGMEVGTAYDSDIGQAARIYNFAIPNGETTMTVTPLAQETNASITVNGASLSNGSVSVPYYEGSNNQMLITVKAPDGVRTCQYWVNITQLPSSDATLSALTVNGMRDGGYLTGGTLSPAFDPGTADYTMDVTYNTTSVRVNATSNSNKATVSINGGTASAQYGFADVSLGDAGTTTTVTITVTAEDNSQETYTVHVTRQTQSTRELSSLGISSGTLSPAFSPDNFYYTLTMPTTAASVALTPVDLNYGDSITINNQSVNSNGTATVNLTPGTSTDIAIFVQPHDGSSGGQTYTLHVTWEKPTWQDAGFVATGFGGGTGTQSSPYLIGTPGELAYLAQQVNAGNDFDGAFFRLTADLDLSGRYWVPIGNRGTAFSGTFDGNGHSISGLAMGTQTDPDASYASGLFGYVVSNGVIRNLSADASVYTVGVTGILVGVNEGTVEGCSSSGSATGVHLYAYDILGGIAGENDGTIRGCYSTASLTDSGESDVGGITGDNYGEIVNCYSTGALEAGFYGSIGGIAGYNDCMVANCYAKNTISGGDESFAGGIAGYSDSDITNCYAACDIAVGDISSDGGAGGVAGYTDGGNYTHDYWSLDAAQKVDGTVRSSTALLGIGYGADTTTGLHGSAMADTTSAPTFAHTLTANRTDASAQRAWKYVTGVNGGLPVLDGVGDGVGASSDAALSALTVSTGTLSPSFSSSEYSYSVSVSSGAGSISVTPVTDDSLASVTVNGKAVASGHSAVVTLAAEGETDIRVAVTAEDGVTAKTYSITVTRGSSSDGAQVVTDDGTGIRADLSGAKLPAGVTSVSLRVSPVGVTAGTYQTIVKIGSDSKLGRLKGLTVYSMELLDQNGNPITNFTGKIKVQIPIPAGMSGNLHVYWYDPVSGTLTDMGATKENGYLVFYTTHFSDYAVAQLDSSASSGTSESTGGSTPSETSTPVENPKTGDEGWPMLPLALLGGGMATGLVIVRRRKIFRRRRNNT